MVLLHVGSRAPSCETILHTLIGFVSISGFQIILHFPGFFVADLHKSGWVGSIAGSKNGRDFDTYTALLAVGKMLCFLLRRKAFLRISGWEREVDLTLLGRGIWKSPNFLKSPPPGRLLKEKSPPRRARRRQRKTLPRRTRRRRRDKKKTPRPGKAKKTPPTGQDGGKGTKRKRPDRARRRQRTKRKRPTVLP